MKKFIAAAAATGLLLIGAAAPASAETMYRNGANKVTITAKGAPKGAPIITATVTVKKGKKTVARNKPFYKAKKGKYKVTSIVSYYSAIATQVQGPSTQVQTPSTQVQVPPTTKLVPLTQGDLVSEHCTVFKRTIADHTVAVTDYWVGDEGGTGMLEGLAAVTYTGGCSAWVYDEYNVAHPLAWTDDWTEVVDISQAVNPMSLPFDVDDWLDRALENNTLVASPQPFLVAEVVDLPGDGTELEKIRLPTTSLSPASGSPSPASGSPSPASGSLSPASGPRSRAPAR